VIKRVGQRREENGWNQKPGGTTYGRLRNCGKIMKTRVSRHGGEREINKQGGIIHFGFLLRTQFKEVPKNKTRGAGVPNLRHPKKIHCGKGIKKSLGVA